MEYTKNTMYYPNATFGRRSAAQAVGTVSDTNIQSKSHCLSGASLAMVYSPCQQFENIYEPTEALRCGTLFCKLYMPFTGRGR